jgi:hypothetical protein
LDDRVGDGFGLDPIVTGVNPLPEIDQPHRLLLIHGCSTFP